MTHPQENKPTSSVLMPAWLRVVSVFVLGLIAPALGRFVGRSVGDEGVGAAVAAALFVAVVIFTMVRREGSRIRAASEALIGGAVIGSVFWYFSR